MGNGRVLTRNLKNEIDTLGRALQAIASTLTDPSVRSPFSEVTEHKLIKVAQELTELYPPQVDERERMTLDRLVQHMAREYVIENKGKASVQAIADRCFSYLNKLKVSIWDTPGATPPLVLQQANSASGTKSSEFFNPSIENVLLSEVQDYLGETV